MAFSRAQRARETTTRTATENNHPQRPSIRGSTGPGRRPRPPRPKAARSAATTTSPWAGGLGRVCIVVALVSAYFLRYSGRPMPAGEIAVIVLTPIIWVGVFQAFDLYAIQHLARPRFRRIIGASSVGIVLALASYWSHSSLSGLGGVDVGAGARAGAAHAALLAGLGVAPATGWAPGVADPGGRHVSRGRAAGGDPRAPGSGFLPLGYARALEAGHLVGSANSLPVFGGIDELDRLVREQDVDCLFVASTGITWRRCPGLADGPPGGDRGAGAGQPAADPDLAALAAEGGARHRLALKPVRLSGRQAAMKRAFDLVVASAALILTAPLWVVIAVAIRLDSRGPVFFSQERVTKDGRIFRMHKFRSMRTGADAALDTTRPFFKLQSDPRLTRVGAFLRRFSLDELPQFWNVITGDMSIVGPRPLPADQVAANLELLSPRHVVPAGVTGWWQTNGRSRVTPEEALRLDLFYIENWSPTLDLYILLKTFGAVVGGRRPTDALAPIPSRPEEPHVRDSGDLRPRGQRRQLAAMSDAIAHRGPDAAGTWTSPDDGDRCGSGTGACRSSTCRPRPTSRSSRTGWCWCSAARSTTTGSCGPSWAPPDRLPHRLRHRGAAGGVAPLGPGEPPPPARHVRLRAVRRAPGHPHPGPRPVRHQAAVLDGAGRRRRLRLGAEGAATAARRPPRDRPHRHRRLACTTGFPRTTASTRASRSSPPGSWLQVGPDGRRRLERFFDPARRARRAVRAAGRRGGVAPRAGGLGRRHLVADVPISTFLSGGLDSSLLTVLAARQNRDIDSYTISFRPEDRRLEAMPDDTTPASWPASTASGCTRSRSPPTWPTCSRAWCTRWTSRSATRPPSTPI